MPSHLSLMRDLARAVAAARVVPGANDLAGEALVMQGTVCRRSSRFSRSSVLSRSCSLVVSLGDRLWSASARRTRLPGVSSVMPSLAATELIAAHWESVSYTHLRAHETRHD